MNVLFEAIMAWTGIFIATKLDSFPCADPTLAFPYLAVAGRSLVALEFGLYVPGPGISSLFPAYLCPLMVIPPLPFIPFRSYEPGPGVDSRSGLMTPLTDDPILMAGPLLILTLPYCPGPGVVVSLLLYLLAVPIRTPGLFPLFPPFERLYCPGPGVSDACKAPPLSYLLESVTPRFPSWSRKCLTSYCPAAIRIKSTSWRILRMWFLYGFREAVLWSCRKRPALAVRAWSGIFISISVIPFGCAYFGSWLSINSIVVLIIIGSGTRHIVLIGATVFRTECDAWLIWVDCTRFGIIVSWPRHSLSVGVVLGVRSDSEWQFGGILHNRSEILHCHLECCICIN